MSSPPQQPQEPLDLQALLLAILEVGATSTPNPDGTLTEETKAKMQKLAALAGGGQQQQPAPMSNEAYGSEPPGPGWRSAGDGKWVKDA